MMEAHIEGSREDAGEPIELRFSSGKMGCGFLLAGLCALAFGWWAVRPDSLADTRLSHVVELGRSLEVAGVNLPVLAIALYLLWQAWDLGMRWADAVAVRAGQDGIRFHPTLLRRAVPWAEVRDVRYRIARPGLARVPEIVFTLDGRSVSIRGFDDEGGGGERFAGAVRARLRR